MLSYRLHIYGLAMTVSAEATQLVLSLSPYQDWGSYTVEVQEEMLERDLPDLQRQTDNLASSIKQFENALPPDFNFRLHARNLLRHLSWIRRRIGERRPSACTTDPVDIVSKDLFDTLDAFEAWYTSRSLEDRDFADRMEPFITQGQLNSAIREAWAIFKTRMVNRFGLEDSIDGHRLADALFSSNGAAAEQLTDEERTGYHNLFKGLYSLSRNPVAHNDLPMDPEFSRATLALINSAIVRIETGYSQT